MLQNTMNHQELMREVYADLEKVLTPARLLRYEQEYNRERKRNNICSKAAYPKVFEVRTKRKNDWILVFSKPPSVSEYKGEALILPFTHYASTNGLRVVKPVPNANRRHRGLTVFYNEELFWEYKEKMNLNFNDPLEIVKHFFSNNSQVDIRWNSSEWGGTSFARIKNGILLGSVQNNGECIVHEAFLKHEELSNDQVQEAKEMCSNLQERIEQLLNENEFDRAQYNMCADVAIALNQQQ